MMRSRLATITLAIAGMLAAAPAAAQQPQQQQQQQVPDSVRALMTELQQLQQQLGQIHQDRKSVV